jgi:citrate synthase
LENYRNFLSKEVIVLSEYISSISNDALSTLCEELSKNTHINPEYYQRFDVKRGLRNADATGVLAGLTRVCSVEGYYIDDGEKCLRRAV